MYFSIITATRNAATTLPRLLDSLAEQTCRDFELIVQDGVSSDSTVAVAESYRHRLPALSIASEPDSGIYDAWNKAVGRAKGDWLIFLGADDALAEAQVLARAKALLAQQSETLLFAAGRGRLVFPDGAVHAELEVDLEKSRELFEYGCPVCHPSLFYNKTLFASDRFDASFRIAADYDFLLQHWQVEHILPLDFVVTEMQVGGISTTAATRWATLKETLRIAKRRLGYYPRPLLALAPKSLLHLALNKLLGEQRGNRIYDGLRRLNGREAFWARQDKP